MDQENVERAEDVLVTIGTTNPAEPYRKVSLQMSCDAMVGEVLDRQAETQKLLEMVTNLGAMVETMQREFEKIAKELHATTTTAKTIMHAPRPKTGREGMN
jgi:hypothetical protein